MDLRKHVLGLLSQLKTDRSTWDTHWRDLADHVSPWRIRFQTSERNKGTKKHDKIIDGTASLALRTGQAGMMSGITSPARPWFKLGVPDPSLTEVESVKEWLAEVEKRMRAVFLRSNLYNALPVAYGDLLLFGTAAVTVEEHPTKVMRFQALPAGSYCIANGADLLADTMVREIELTARQVRDEFGEEACSERVKGACRNGRHTEIVKVIQAIYPNQEHDQNKIGGKFKRFRSVTIEATSSEDKVLRDSGFDEFPALCPRWTTVGEDAYGIGPGFDALGDVRALQAYERKVAKAVDKQIDPPLKGPTSMRNSVVTMLPGGINWVDDRNGADSLRPVHEVNFRIEGAELKSQQIRQRISRAFYEDLFLMLAQSDRRQITAREVEERHEEKLLMLGPVLERLNQELLDPLIDRTFNVMARRGMLPPPPPELEGVDLRVEYISIMAQAQKMLGIAAVDRLMAFTGNLAAVNQAVLDKVDMDQAVDEYGDYLGVSPRIIRSDEQVAQMRADRAQAQQQQAAAEQLSMNAQSAKVLSQTDVRGDNGLTALLNSSRGLPA
jgi:Bacteriophage head to tail connecting protein